MQLGELKCALKSGVPLLWQGRYDYERATGRLTGIILRTDEKGNDVFSCELTSSASLSGRCTVITCRPEELSIYKPTGA